MTTTNDLPKEGLCAAGCKHPIATHREFGCNALVAGDQTCDCYAPFGRALPSDEAPR